MKTSSASTTAVFIPGGTTDAGITRSSNRIGSIDFLRGLVMVIMALDHTRDFFHWAAFTDEPTNLQTTTPQLFFTRFITHYCAPIFTFLAGTSGWFQAQRKSKRDLSMFLFKRGLWLVFVDVALISLAISFDPTFHFFLLQTLWAIGWSMMVLAAAIHLPFKTIFAIGALLVLGHNALDFYEQGQTQVPIWYEFLHRPGQHFFDGNRVVMLGYPILPWIGVMLLGYCFGSCYTSMDEKSRSLLFRWLGIGLIAAFVVIRAVNIYGDPFPWSAQKNTVYTVLSFFNVTKYPPSLLYLCITIGPGIWLLSRSDLGSGKIGRVLSVYGSVPFFYYILHFYLLHVFAAIAFLLRGHSLADAVKVTNTPVFIYPNEGYNLPVVYGVWIGTVILLYPLCVRFSKYKKTHRQWWLSYL